MKNSEKKELLAESKNWFPGSKTGSNARSLSAKEGHKLLENAGLILTSLRLPSSAIEQLKKMAENEGLKYQTYIRKVLIQHAQNRDTVESRLAKVEREIKQLKKTG